MTTKRVFSTTLATFLTLASMTAWAQEQHQEHHPDQGQQTDQMAAQGGGMSPMCPMMMGGGMQGGGMQGGGMMGGGMQDGGMMGQMMDGMGGMMGVDTENLTEQQRERLAALHGRQAEEHFKLMLEMQQARTRMQELTSAQPIDTEAVAKSYDTLAQARKEMFLSHLRARQQMQEIVGQQPSSGAATRQQ